MKKIYITKTKIIKSILLTAFTVFAILFYGCATIIGGSKQPIGLSSSPSGAKISINGKYFGNTPMTAKLPRKEKSTTIKIELKGYQPYETTLKREFNSWYIGNLIFGGVIGLIVDAVDGAMYKLTPEQVQATLNKSRGEGIGYLNNENFIYVALVKNADPSWEKIGYLKKNK